MTTTIYDPALASGDISGIELTTRAFASTLSWSPIPLAIAAILFATAVRKNCVSPITLAVVCPSNLQRSGHPRLRLLIPFFLALATLLFGIGTPPVYAQVDVEDWSGTVEVRVTGKTQGLTAGDVFTYELRLTEPPTEDGWWVRIHADGVVYTDGVYKGLRWIPSVGWEFNPQNYDQWRNVHVRVNEDLDQTVTFTHEVFAHDGTCPIHNVGHVTVDLSGDAPPTPEEDLPRLSISDAATVTEGEQAVFTVTLNPASSQPVAVDYTTRDGSAVAGSDYTTTAGTFRFGPNETTKTIRVPIVSDSTAERSENFSVVLSNPNGATVSDGTGAATIEADPMPGLRISDAAPVAEGNDAVFTVTLSPASSQTVTVDYTTSDGTATAGSDYTTTSGPLTFAAGDETKTIRVPVLHDTEHEPSETFTVRLSNPTGTTLADRDGRGTIEADPTPDLSIADAATVTEGSEAVFTVTLSPPSRHVVEVAYATQDGTAIEGIDYTATSGPLRFEPNEMTKTVRVPVLQDSTAEPSESFTVELSNPNRATVSDGIGTATIEADPIPELRISDAAPVAEGNSAVFTVSLSTLSSQVVTVEYRTVDGTADAGSDYTDTSGTLRFDPLEPTKTIEVPVLTDSMSEPSEDFEVELRSPSRATLGDARGLGTIAADPMPGLSIDDAAPVAEGNDAVFTVTLHPQSSQVVTVTYNTMEGTATANSDYTPQSGTLTFNPSQTTKTIRVPVLTDTTQESSETFTVELSNPVGTMLADSTGLGTIEADPMPGLSIADADPVAEGNDAVFSVTLHPASNQVVTVFYATMDGTATAGTDYTAASDTLTFNPNETTKTIRVPVLRDTEHEPSETFTVELSNPTGTTLADSSGLGTIEADSTPALSIADAAPVAEGREAVFTVTLRPASNHVVGINYATQDGTAVAGEDYTAVTGSLRFEPRETRKTIRVPVLHDTVQEMSETFTVELSNPTGTTLADPTGVGTIKADSEPGLRIADAAPVAEGDMAVFTVTLTPTNTQLVTVAYATVDGTAVADEDYTPASGTLRFEPGDRSKSIRVPVLRDMMAEAVETFTVVLSSPVGASVVDETGVGTITADDEPALSIADAETVAEGGEAVFPVTLSPASGQVVTVAYATQDGTAVADSDYTATSGTLRFEPGETIQTIQVATLRDAIAEPSESFTVELSDPVGTAITNSTGVGTIAADAMPALSITDAVPVAEGGEATFMVSLSPASSELVTVAYATMDGTAVAGSDYTAASGTLQFDPGMTSHTIRVAVLNDTAVEPTETFAVELSDPVRATLADGTGVGTITDHVENRVERAIQTGLPEVGRAMAFSAVTCRIDRKMSDTKTWDNAGRLGGGGLPPAATLGGHATAFGGSGTAFGSSATGFGGSATIFGGPAAAFGDSPFPTHGSMTPGQQLGNLSFLMAAQEAAEGGGGRVAAWGCGDYRRLSGAGELGTGRWNGEVYSLHVGVDVRLGSNVLAGVSVSRSRGMVDYAGGLGSGTDGGKHDLRLVGVHPFLGWSAKPGLQLWGTVGHAWGELRIVDELGGLTGAATLNSGALGLNGRLFTRGSTTLSLRGEGALAQLTADSATVEVATIDMWRFRLTTELSHELLFSSGTSLTPWAELGARHDGGDGQTGAGLEVGGGLRYRVPHVGLTAEGYGRWLAVHEGTLQEWGVGAMVTIDPGMDRRGLSASITPSWGETASGVQRLWQQGAAGPAGYGTSRAQVDAQLGYGVPVLWGRGVLTPFGAIDLAGDEARRYRLGGSLASSRRITVSLEVERWERARLDAMHSVVVRGTAEF